MADEITKESDTAVRIKDTEGRVIELSYLKSELDHTDARISESIALHTRSIQSLIDYKTKLEKQISDAEKLGVVEGQK